MVNCSKCGAENEDARFCFNCGSSLYPEKRIQKRGDTCFGEGGRRRDYFGLISFGIFLLVIGIVFTENPNVFSEFRLWIEQFINERRWIRPPKGLIESATIFFGLMGLLNFLEAGIRFVFDKFGKRFLADVFSGVALLSFAYLIYLYGNYVLRGRMVLAIEVIVCGLFVIMYGLMRNIF